MHQSLRMAGVSQFACVQLYRFYSSFLIVLSVHVMKAACKYVEVLLAFASYQQHSLGGLTVVLHRQ